GFALVALAARTASDHVCFQTKLLRTLSCDSLIGGQALDLTLAAHAAARERDQVSAMKTVPLFVLAAEAGCLAPDIDAGARECAIEFSREYGISYQMVDDLLDGETADVARVERQLRRTQSHLESFPLPVPELEEMICYLNAKIWANDRHHR
ncbi:MAG: polyprenyl synthetase family protein, partial [Acidobacteriaceae bacterium]|nr:polyprenyl synthetase family protein [Acidobacteriaceae bacterium]